MDRRLALVTGASAGIGAAFARRLAAEGYDLALTARRRERLEALGEELRERHGAGVWIAPADLSAPQGPQVVIDQLAAAGRPVAVLVNNAGYGLPGAFAQTAWADQRAQLQLMAVSPCELAHRLAPDMRAQGFGRIVNVASLAGLVPGMAGRTLYAATKSLMIKFSESLHLELRPHGVHVTALCPGFTYTEFHDVNGSRAQISRATPRWAWGSAEAVVDAGWRAAQANRPVCLPGLVNKAAAALCRIVPDRLALEVIAAHGRRFPHG
jgi:short-subunit dehydrogenase